MENKGLKNNQQLSHHPDPTTAYILVCFLLGSGPGLFHGVIQVNASLHTVVSLLNMVTWTFLLRLHRLHTQHY